jgi:hypothetical protein
MIMIQTILPNPRPDRSESYLLEALFLLNNIKQYSDFDSKVTSPIVTPVGAFVLEKLGNIH